ncbi:MAG: hypothetical protein ABIR46_03475 [Candidatus Saccharimonadales bacterium]
MSSEHTGETVWYGLNYGRRRDEFEDDKVVLNSEEIEDIPDEALKQALFHQLEEKRQDSLHITIPFAHFATKAFSHIYRVRTKPSEL